MRKSAKLQDIGRAGLWLLRHTLGRHVDPPSYLEPLRHCYSLLTVLTNMDLYLPELIETELDEGFISIDIIQSGDTNGSLNAAHPRDAYIAGLTLLDLASKDGKRGERILFDQEISLLDECFSIGVGVPSFRTYHVQALRKALKTQNWNLTKYFLERGGHDSILQSIPDALQLAIGASTLWYGGDPDSLAGHIQLLISHGADVKSLDDKGNTPLYYACVTTHVKTFGLLLENGADWSTLHTAYRVPRADLDNELLDGPADCNLLKITIDARLALQAGGTGYSFLSYPLSQKFGPIIARLLDIGLKCEPNDSSLIRLFHIACFQGEMEMVEKMLSIGAPLDAGPGVPDDMFRYALHAASAGLKKDTAQRLLELGADLCCKCVVHKKYRYYSQNWEKPISAIEAALKCGNQHRMHTDYHKENVLGFCEVLINSGADQDDVEQVMETCAKMGDVDLLKRLLDRGGRLINVPICENVEVVRLLFEHGSHIDYEKFQSHAVEKGKLELMRYLVEQGGPSLGMDNFGYTAYNALRVRGGSLEILEYLVTGYGLDINLTFPWHPSSSKRINFLQRACQEQNVEAVELLLKHGADTTCPGLSQTALQFLKGQVSGTKPLKIVALLLRYEGGRDAAAAREASGWKMPYPPGHEANESYISLKELASSAQTLAPIADGIRNVGAHEESEDGIEGTDNTSGIVPITPIPSVEPLNDSTYILSNKINWYKPLSGPLAFRYIILEPSSSENPLICRLISSHLSEKPSYEAVSYVRNDPSPKVPISLDGHAVYITVSLWKALYTLRKSDMPRTLCKSKISLYMAHLQHLLTSWY